jgi:Otopetrin
LNVQFHTYLDFHATYANVSNEFNNRSNSFVSNFPAIISNFYLNFNNIEILVLNTTEMDHGYHKVISRFGLMHMVATNLTDWFSVLVEETKHEILHLAHASNHHNSHDISVEMVLDDLHNSTIIPTLHNETITTTSHEMPAAVFAASQKYQECLRTNIMGSLVQNASPFLFPCTIEYSLICAVILFEMWKKVRSIPEINKTRRNSLKPGGHLSSSQVKSAYHFSIDCSKAHRGMFAGIVVIVMTIICLIMYFVLHQHKDYDNLAMKEVIIYEICIYTVCSVSTIIAFIRMRDLKFQQKAGAADHHASTVKLDCTLLVMAAVGVYVYGMFSIIGSVFAYQDETNHSGEKEDEILYSRISCENLILFQKIHDPS